MLLVVDANKIFSALLSKGRTLSVFLVNLLYKKFDLIAPEFLFFEIGKHLDELIERSELSRKEISTVFKLMKEQIEFIPFNDFNRFDKQAEQISPHPKDIQYFALALYSECGIWSDEKSFRKQNEVRIFSNSELLNELKFKV